jgi:ATP-dependent helicase/nuclease subunit B
MTGDATPRFAERSVYTIAAGVPFLDVLAAGIRSRVGDAPEALPAVRVLLPTRRSCRALIEAFLRGSGGRPLLLPRISPIGDVDEDEIAFADEGDDADAADVSIPPAIPSLRRQLLLARLIQAVPGSSRSPDQAVRLAGELARFVDHVHTECLDFRRLVELVPAELAQHWQITLGFLDTLAQAWPRVLAAEGCIDAADRRNRLLAARAAAWRASPPATMVVAAGSTGSIPATAALLEVVSRLPAGAVVLPGLDLDAGDETWEALEPTHPQYGMARLLQRIGIHRQQVRIWRSPGQAMASTGRTSLINRALRPAATADRWRSEPPVAADALAGVKLIEAPGPDEETRAIALILRQALETEGQTAALVTPDRGLARRLAMELERWGILVDDSAGQPLAQTPPVSFLRLIAEAVLEALTPVPLLAMLKHPLAGGGLHPAAFRAMVRRLETTALRGPRPAPGLAGLAAAAGTGDGGELETLIGRVGSALAPLLRACAADVICLDALLAAHIQSAESLAATTDAPGSARLWAGEAGEAAAGFVAELIESGADFRPFPPRFYLSLLDALLVGRVVRPRYGRHPRLFVWGPLEARLQQANVMVLGGLNENSWPPAVEPSPWMSRPMMKDFGLPVPERRVGLSAHDFTQAFSAPQVWLTRSLRAEGTPTVESRWLLRLRTLIQGSLGERQLLAGEPILQWQRLLDVPERLVSVPPPAPTPPVAARPRKLSVTQIELWMRDPYSVYARHVLRLRALDPLDADPGAAEYGAFIHDAIDLFLKDTAGELGNDAYDRLLAAGRKVLGSDIERPGINAFWWPRFERIAAWFVSEERQRRTHLQKVFSEQTGHLTLDGPAGPFELSARADRIDLLADGTLAVVDYKTGGIPSSREVAAGYAPQLPLEAAIAAAGGFSGVPRAPVSVLEYWRLKGGEPPGERKAMGDNPQALADQSIAGLCTLVAAFDREETPYAARPRPALAPRYSDYEHLARVKEWSAGGGEEGE